MRRRRIFRSLDETDYQRVTNQHREWCDDVANGVDAVWGGDLDSVDEAAVFSCVPAWRKGGVDDRDRGFFRRPLASAAGGERDERSYHPEKNHRPPCGEMTAWCPVGSNVC